MPCVVFHCKGKSSDIVSLYSHNLGIKKGMRNVTPLISKAVQFELYTQGLTVQIQRFRFLFALLWRLFADF